MVQVLPAVPTFGSRLSAALGEALGDTGSAYAKQSVLENQLSQLQNAKDPKELATSLVRLSARVPGSERYVAPLYQTLLQQMQGSMSPSIASITGAGGVSGLPGSTPVPGGTPAADQASRPVQSLQNDQQGVSQASTVQNETPVSRGTGIQLGQYAQLNPNELVSPDKRAEILRQIKIAGGDVDFTSKLIDDYNAGKIQFNDLLNANVDKQTAQIQTQLSLEDQIKKRIDQQLPEDTSPNKRNIYYNLVNKELPKHKDFTSAYQAVTKKIVDFDKLEKKVISSIPSTGFYGLTKNQEETLRQSAQPLLKEDPLAYNVLEEVFVQQGNSIVDAAKTLKPLSGKVKNVVDAAGDYKELIYPKPSFFSNFTEKDMLRNIEQAEKGQSKEVDSLFKKLDPLWDDSVSLINIYADLSGKGWLPQQIRSLFDRLSDKFSSQQQTERAQLNEHPRIPIRYLTE